ncbi:MAG: aminotransferase class IV [Acidihalobacter sp.]|jgi:branched-chain amino acid aminotransferase
MSTQDVHHSSQGFADDPRNNNLLVFLNGDFIKKESATVSIFDSGFVLGDGVWEGIRLVNGQLFAVEEHVDRLFQGANAIQLDIGLSKEGMIQALRDTVAINKMTDGVHIRLMVTRGEKKSPTQDPRFVIGKPTIAIVAEYKMPNPALQESGLKLLTSTIRCSGPDVFDLRLNSHSRLNFIQALLQAINAGCDEALMLDMHGFVASCNSTNFFMVRGEELWTSTGRFNFKGITRSKIIKLFEDHIGTVQQTDFTLAELYSADEAFVTGTFGGVTPVSQVDGRKIGDEMPGPLTKRIRDLYLQSMTGRKVGDD